MTTLRLILGDQLSPRIASLEGTDPDRDVVLMVEVSEETRYVPHHPQKIALVLSAMRHFARELEAAGHRVDYVHLDDPQNSGTFGGEVARAVSRHGAERVVATHPGEWRVLEAMQGWHDMLGVPVEIRDDGRFLCPLPEFREWAKGRRQLRMEYFYREMRRRTGWLMESGKPAGGRWNYDRDNRKPLPADARLPQRPRFEPDALTREVMELVQREFGRHFGALEGFGWAVTRRDALCALEAFITESLPQFGDYQDAMQAEEDFLYHALVSPYLNIGLLDPAEVCEAAVAAWHANQAPLHCVEGFVRQVLGWREFVRGVYWLKMPDYASGSFLDAERPLPSLYWGSETRMRCLAQTIDATRRNAYAHHIQRLMVTGNFALLAGIRPGAVEAWYLAVYIDAFEWVELPNTRGMALFADGGVLASKPYAASGAYIHRMSDYCGDCAYKPSKKLGPDACPFNYLYWDFLMRNAPQLRDNPRLAMPYRTLAKMDDDRKQRIRAEAAAFLEGLD